MRRRYVFREVVGCLRPRFAARSRVLVGVLGEQVLQWCKLAIVATIDSQPVTESQDNNESQYSMGRRRDVYR
jgi:hypothetical protein